MPSLVLTGFMATGKSAVGRTCARRLGRRFVDMDARIEARAGLRVPEIFARFGEARFRDLETAVARDLAAERGLVIATGGGAMLRAENREALGGAGIVVCLRATPEVIARRVGGTGHRPLLAGAARPTQVELIERVRALLEARRAVYDLFPLQVDTSDLTIEQSADRVIALYRAAAAGRGRPPAGEA